MSYVNKQVVIEDGSVSTSCPGYKHVFTGGKSEITYPQTISFKSPGDYTVHIDDSQVIVKKIK